MMMRRRDARDILAGLLVWAAGLGIVAVIIALAIFGPILQGWLWSIGWHFGGRP